MTFDEFINKWNNRGIDFDGYYGDQCMDLMHQYHVEVLGITDGRTLAAASAKDVYLNFNNVYNNQLFDRIANTPTGVPQKGDIMLWGTGIGPYGHVAIFIDGDANKFRSFDQNFPTGSKCKIVNHNYTGVLGWLRIKVKPNTGEDVVCDKKSIRDMLVAKATHRDDVCTYLGLSVDPKQTDSNKITSTIGGFKSRITDLTNQLNDVKPKYEDSKKEVSSLNSQLLELDKERQGLLQEVKEQFENFQAELYPSKNPSGYVYIILGDGYYKVGKSIDPDQRIAQLQTASPYPLKRVVVEKVRDMNYVESALQYQFKDKLIRGEWFTLADSDIAKAKEIILQYAPSTKPIPFVDMTLFEKNVYLQAQIDQYVKDKDALQIELTQLNAQFNELKRNSVKSLSVNDLIILLFQKIGGKV